MADDLVEYAQSEEVRNASREYLASLSDDEIRKLLANQRDEKGRFIKGAPSPNPKGRPESRRRPRLFSKDQAVADFLELIEQPVTVTKGGKEQTVPASKAIYDRMIHLAVGGDWNAIKKCVELREKYSQEREDTVIRLKESADRVRDGFEFSKTKMPDDVRALVDLVDQRVEHLQFNAEL